MFKGTVIGVVPAETWGSRLHPERGRGDKTTDGAVKQQVSRWLGADGSCQVLRADGGFQLIILVKLVIQHIYIYTGRFNTIAYSLCHNSQCHGGYEKYCR